MECKVDVGLTGKHIKGDRKTELTIKYTDMPEKMKETVISLGHRALGRFQTEIDIATYIKDYMDKTYRGGRWHAFVGRNIKVCCSYENGKFIHFFIGDLAFIIFRTEYTQ
ncbi:dynein light chain 1, cytoplasmic-like [Cimex lectularius]|uniref:Dynein light chain n=1 Tax=Cimex lectularius TaxID=79782 RepID=A0A8I6S5P2_CIMLE|nr:dynein light chain 1, cytoplasmic-like [Cimex lectularius]